MLGRGYYFGFSGWEDPPFPRPRDLDRLEMPFDAIIPPANEPDRVLFEIGLVLVTPLALALGVTWLLNWLGLVT